MPVCLMWLVAGGLTQVAMARRAAGQTQATANKPGDAEGGFDASVNRFHAGDETCEERVFYLIGRQIADVVDRNGFGFPT